MYYQCVDLIMDITPQSAVEIHDKKVLPGQPNSLIKALVNACCAMQPLSGRFKVAIKLISPAKEGYLCRKDVFEWRMRECELVHAIVQLSDAVKYRPIGDMPSNLLEVLESCAAAFILRNLRKSHQDLLDLLQEDLKMRLSFAWTVSRLPVKKKVALIGGKGKSNPPDGIPLTAENRMGTVANEGTFEAAQALDIALVIVDQPDHWLGTPHYSHLRESFIGIDMTIEQNLALRIFDALKGLDLDGIITLTDSLLVPTAQAAKLLNLPTEPITSYLQSTDKFEMRKIFGKDMTFLRLSDLRELESYAELHGADSLPYPLIIKPCHGSGSLGVKRANNFSEACEAIQQIEASGRSAGGILVETYIDGPELDVNFVLCDGQICFFELSDEFPKQGDEDYATVSQTFFETSNVLPSALSTEEIAIVQSTLHQNLLQLGFRTGVFHLEARIRNSSAHRSVQNGVYDLYLRPHGQEAPIKPEVVLMEINARPPGLLGAFATGHTYGVDYYGLHLLLAIQDFDRFKVLCEPFTCGAQYWCEIVCIPVARDFSRVPDDPWGEVFKRHPDIIEHVSKYCCFHRGRPVRLPAKPLWMGYALVYSRTSQHEVMKVGQFLREAFDNVLNST